MIKKLIFPLFLIVIVFLSINYIKPLVVSVLDERKQIADKQSELEATQATVKSIGTLSESRKSLLGSGGGQRVYAYLPVASDHDHVLDIFNYLAVQSGAIVNDVSFAEAKAVSTVSDADVNTTDATSSDVAPVVPVLPEPSIFSVTVRLQGSYESIKLFLKKISTAGRFYTVKSFSIEKKTTGAGAGEDAQVNSDILLASLEADFSYLPKGNYPNAHAMPVFSAGEFSLKSLDQLLALGEGVSMIVEPSVSLRQNPFKP